LSATRWFPFVAAVLEGDARAADVSADQVRVFRASGSGDDEIVERARQLVGAWNPVVVVTSDRGLAERVEEIGASVRGV
ncbi:hypothetical protein, partial [Staphylococcus aureus]